MGKALMTGRCHCGNLTVELETSRAPAELPLRSCQCSFCLRHRSRTVADLDGALRFAARDEAALHRYQFGTRTAQMLVCRTCGGYLGAFLPRTPGSSEGWGITNINLFDRAAEFTQEPSRVDYDGESPEARRARREKNWMPATLRTGP